jgi:hypothetical protein
VGFAEDIAKLLKPPSESDDQFTDIGRQEAVSRLKRAEASYAKDPRGPGAVAAIGFYREALDLDPLCKPAYEGIARIILARAADDRKALEFLSRWVAIARRRLPDDYDIATLEKKVKELLGGPQKTTETRRTQRSTSTGRVKKPTLKCKFCGSPIPADSMVCMSCGERERPAAVKKGGRLGLVFALAGVAAAVIVLVAWRVLAKH